MFPPARTIFIGDVHGCYEELMELLDKLQVQEVNDQVFFVGDLINKGPQSYEVLNLVTERNYFSIMGNHEYEYLLYQLQREKQIFKKSLEKDNFFWIKNLPYFKETENFLLVHAGFDPRKSFQSNSLEDFINIREIANKPWHDFYQKEKPVIYGHWARQGLKIKKNSIGLDSGCVYGGELTAYILEEKKIVQVKAKKSYQPIKK